MKPWIDLTYPLDTKTWIYQGDDYSDPQFASEHWASVADNGFEVWKLSLGTQMGTHVDAPSHFVTGAATLDDFNPQDCVGTYILVSAQDLTHAEFSLDWKNDTHLFLDARKEDVADPQAVKTLLQLPVRVIVMAGGLRVDHDDPLWFHKEVARAGKFLVEDLMVDASLKLPTRGQIITAPLRLTGLSGSPARVLVQG